MGHGPDGTARVLHTFMTWFDSAMTYQIGLLAQVRFWNAARRHPDFKTGSIPRTQLKRKNNMWLLVVFILVGFEPQLFNALPAQNEAECRHIAELSNRMFPNRVTLCVFVDESESV